MTKEEKIEFMKQDRFATEAAKAVVEETGENYARCSIEISDIHQNAHGGVMGGVIFTLADFAYAIATNTPENYTVNVSSSINFMTMAKGKKLIAETKLIKDGRRNCFYEVDVRDELDTKVAVVMINGVHLG